MFIQNTSRKLYTLDELDEAARDRAFSDWTRECKPGEEYDYKELWEAVEDFNASQDLGRLELESVHGPGTEKFFARTADSLGLREAAYNGLEPLDRQDAYGWDLACTYNEAATPAIRANMRAAMFVLDVYDRYCLEWAEGPDECIYDANEADNVLDHSARSILAAVAASANEIMEAISDYWWSAEAFEAESDLYDWLYNERGELVGSAEALEGLEEVA